MPKYTPPSSPSSPSSPASLTVKHMSIIHKRESTRLMSPLTLGSSSSKALRRTSSSMAMLSSVRSSGSNGVKTLFHNILKSPAHHRTSTPLKRRTLTTDDFLNSSTLTPVPPSATPDSINDHKKSKRRGGSVSALAKKLFASKKEKFSPPSRIGTPSRSAVEALRVLSPEARSETLHLDLCSALEDRTAFCCTEDDETTTTDCETDYASVCAMFCESTPSFADLCKRRDSDSIFYL